MPHMAEGQHDLGKIAVAPVATAGHLICSQKTFFFRLFSFFQFPFHKTGNPERTVPYLALRQIQLSVPLTEILPHLRVGG